MEDLLKKLKVYRKNLSNPPLDDSFIKELEYLDLKDFTEQKQSKIDIEDKENIYAKCKISRKEARTGCVKKIKTTIITENRNKEDRIIQVKIPKEIKNGQYIILREEGNYLKDKGIRSNLIIKIIVK